MIMIVLINCKYIDIWVNFCTNNGISIVDDQFYILIIVSAFWLLVSITEGKLALFVVILFTVLSYQPICINDNGNYGYNQDSNANMQRKILIHELSLSMNMQTIQQLTKNWNCMGSIGSFTRVLSVHLWLI